MSKAPIPAKMAHIVLRTADVSRLVDWYQTVLGCDIVYQEPPPRGIVFLSFDEEHHRVAIVGHANDSKPDPGGAGMVHFAYSYASIDDLLTTYVRIEEAGVKPIRCVNHRMSTSFYYVDPDGNGVELFTDNPGTEAELKSAFTLETVNFDVDDMLQRWRAGATPEELAAPQ
ncbi:MAG: VOC family protein [Alphaproteobacteria bacterium]|nr:VOC family protein [Alphaproteobacteria bacterium]